ncbi:hypothetical protein [Vibrio breoganii]|uniref:hypothetical protein n=1 Tax=Vibrio breoganii TaxID=553239 RepID=UPI000C826A40|nr:hypothetical protein [Vibrio breoganii]PML92984.1 hypothetical protein BCT64_14835 [Vibrio breoganii]PMN61614.1 hypothetical protein BCT28_11500 [Vibrio breoganii]
MSINKVKGYIVTFLVFALIYSMSPYHGGAAISSTLKIFGFGIHMLFGVGVIICLPLVIEKTLDKYRPVEK